MTFIQGRWRSHINRSMRNVRLRISGALQSNCASFLDTAIYWPKDANFHTTLAHIHIAARIAVSLSRNTYSLAGIWGNCWRKHFWFEFAIYGLDIGVLL